jgi:Zn ribbon nucleic-acid-binding protein
MIDRLECPECRKFGVVRMAEPDADGKTHRCLECGYRLKAFFVMAGPAPAKPKDAV